MQEKLLLLMQLENRDQIQYLVQLHQRVEVVEVQEEVQQQKLDYLEDLEVEDLEMEEQQVLEILRQ